MPATTLEHYLVRTEDLEATREFYCDVLGLKVGDRPSFPFDGYWLYLGDTPVVHLVINEGGEGQEGFIGGKVENLESTGPIDHIAFGATDIMGIVNRAKERDLDTRMVRIPDQDLYQVFLNDPNGITIELNFPLKEAEGLDLPQ